MARAHVYKVLQNADGSVLQGASVRVLQDGVVTLLADTLFTTELGGATLPNPFVCTNGIVEFYIAIPRRVQLGVTPVGASEFFVITDAQPPAPEVVRSPIPQIVPNPVAGYVLGSTDGVTLAFVPPPSSPTPNYTIALSNATPQTDSTTAAAPGTSSSASRGDHVHLAERATTVVTETASYNISATDAVVLMNGTSLSATLPTPVGISGRQYVVKNINASPATLGTAAGLIDNVTTKTLNQYDTLTAVSDNANWWLI